MKKTYAISVGECAGIGPEITAKACACCADKAFVVYTSEALFRRACAVAGVDIPQNITFCEQIFAGDVDAVKPGVAVAAVGDLAYRSVVSATKAVLAGEHCALITAPLNKAAMHMAGHLEPGHTELLAHLCGKPETTMAFYSPGLVLSLVTIHCAIADVPGLLTQERLCRVFHDTAAAIQRIHGRRPKIGILALNPHAGEAGAFGREEIDCIVPAMQACTTEAEWVGPLVADTAFTWMGHKPAPVDGYIAMYHDQGLIPFKTYAFDQGVNMTLGLPLVRTSPDHGTAYDLAWKGIASETSMVAAIQLAERMTS